MKGNSDFDTARRQMVARQLADRGIRDRRVLDAMGKVPRERFVPAGSRYEAYADRALAIDCGQTISQPLIVAMMSEALELTGDEHVLEVGTGSGYQAAVLAELAGNVVTIERHAELSAAAGEVLAELGYENLMLVVGDGSLGYPPRAPYDRVMVTAAAASCPTALFDQLVEDGIIAIPVGDGYSQQLQQIRKVAGRPKTTTLTGCRFVPLIGEGT